MKGRGALRPFLSGSFTGEEWRPGVDKSENYILAGAL
jgi:hypothetical protein